MVAGLLNLDGPRFEAAKNEDIDVWRNGAIPLMFHEKRRSVFVSSGGSVVDAVGDRSRQVVVDCDILRRLDGGGLISRLISKDDDNTWFCIATFRERSVCEFGCFVNT